VDLNKLKQYIYTRLDALTEIGVYDGKPTSTATFPYLVFTVQIVRKINTKETGLLKINYWDDTDDDSAILTASKYIKEGRIIDEVELPGFDPGWEVQSDLFYRTYLENESQPTEPESNMSRVLQSFLLIGFAT